ncbi:MAG TPA: peptidase M61 [Bacteroidales bacterium]|jgi:predicted metalloprotease with PDZ domain|nr:peptidase M61 [Bacteroidales bacterium]HBZ21696.1 peptidase M61 [Bacteroidales bacterium]
MSKLQNSFFQSCLIISSLLILSACTLNNKTAADLPLPDLQYTISIKDPSTHCFHVELNFSGWMRDTVDLKMAKWMPGYYQIMDYAKGVTSFSALDNKGKNLPVARPDSNTWRVSGIINMTFRVRYEIKADRRFVANNYLDTTHAYFVPEATFLYVKELINKPVQIRIKVNSPWDKTATGLDSLPEKANEFTTSDFDMLFDCPILAGNLEELPPFEIDGIKHRFIGYNLGSFNKIEFMAKLKEVVKEGVSIFGEIPYKQFTFIGIGPGYGGIEHLNNTTVSFNGNGLDKKESMNSMMSYLAHEYFHNFNVKRIRPFELGPFDYEKENRTNLLWVSEGLSMYYEYLIVKRAGIINNKEFLSELEGNINALENDSGRYYQSLVQSSYNTWIDGPFGNPGKGADKSISYYDKGAVTGLILDLSIRNATENDKSLDDLMRLLYNRYYKILQRGFTDAEFQQAAESVAGISLSREFEYVYTTREIDYNNYLSFAGLGIAETKDGLNGKRRLSIIKLENTSSIQDKIFKGLFGD